MTQKTKQNRQYCFTSPYIGKHFGGGEKYLLDCALVASKHTDAAIAVAVPSHYVQSATDLQKLKQKYEHFLAEDLSQIAFIPQFLSSASSALDKLKWSKQFDLLYYQTDGSLFFSAANRSILHLQIPFTNSLSIIDRLKLKTWNHVNTNSFFTKKIIEKYWQIRVDSVHQPAIVLPELVPEFQEKQKIILHVGRFFKQLHAKRQDVLVKAFRAFSSNKQLSRGWRLVLVGAIEDQAYAEEICKLADGLPVTLIHQATREELVSWYQKASIYWHATGFEVNEEASPEKVEHFGITTAEALSYGLVPVVVAKGGQPEVIGTKFLPYSWETIDECAQKTLDLVADVTKRKALYKQAISQSRQFSRDREFSKRLIKMIQPTKHD